jgi:hypothetical protein
VNREAKVGDHGLAADGGLADGDERRYALGEIEVDPAAEADQPEPLAGAHHPADREIAADAARHQPGDLHEGDVAAVGKTQAHGLPLVVLARLVQRGVDELAAAIGELGDGPVGRDAVDVHVEDVEEDADPRPRALAHAELGRRRRRDHHRHPAVGRADEPPVPRRRHARRVAEEVGAPGGEDGADPAERR